MPILPIFVTAAMLLAACAGFSLGPRAARQAGRIVEWLSLIALAVAIIAVAMLASGAPARMPDGAALAPFLKVQLDVVSATLLLLIAFVGWVVLRYSRTYLEGDPRQGRFLAWMSLTLACVMTLVIAGNVWMLIAGWIGTSLALHRLLLFYPHRPAAQRAAAKKFIAARTGDVALIAAMLLLVRDFGTTDIAAIAQAARASEASALSVWAAGLLAVAAMLKSAQFPLHGWLTEVMEAPTPVSALLHAGVINAGGFLLIRFADVMLLAPGALAALVMIGGFTALFGGLVMLTQPAVKTSLAWSTISQMGFMIMQCGLALFPLALLHIVAHSLYKAHSFLAAGGAVERIAAARRPGPVAVPSLRAVGAAFAAALALYALIGLGFGIHDTSPQAIAMGAILILGIAYLIAQGLAGAAPRALTLRMASYAAAASIGYFTLHALAMAMTAGVLPMPPAPGPLEWVLIVVALLSFGLVAIAQSTFPLWSGHPAVAGLRVHLANGLYLNALWDRLLGGWKIRNI